MIYRLLLFLLLCSSLDLFGQRGGENIWNFLNTPATAKATSLGGQQISITDNNLNFIYNNPSLLNKEMSNQLSLSYVDYLADLKYGYVSYARSFEKYGNFGLGLYHIDYGDFIEADEYGKKLGTFNNVYDYSINAYYSRSVIDSLLTVGGTLKAIGSEYQYWDAFGLAVDLSATYHNQKSNFAAALVVKNIGTQLNTYYGDADREALPFEVQFGITQKLAHAPFRISILARNLETWDLRYKTEEEIKEEADPNNNLPTTGKVADFTDNLARHLIFGIEIVPTQNFYLSLGYNHRRREELKIPDKTGMTGFSWGFGFKIYKFHISYGRARYHLSAVNNHFTLGINLNEFSNKY